jgi:hypothetical protein
LERVMNDGKSIRCLGLDVPVPIVIKLLENIQINVRTEPCRLVE